MCSKLYPTWTEDEVSRGRTCSCVPFTYNTQPQSQGSFPQFGSMKAVTVACGFRINDCIWTMIGALKLFE